MTALNKQAFRKQSVEGSFYLAECGDCGQVMPSSKLRVLHSPDGEADCYCPHCNAQDCEIFDLGTVGSEVVNAWNYQQKRIEALLDELDGEAGRIKELEAQRALAFTSCNRWADKFREVESKLETAERRIAELEARTVGVPEVRITVAESRRRNMSWRELGVYNEGADVAKEKIIAEIRAAGIGVKGE